MALGSRPRCPEDPEEGCRKDCLLKPFNEKILKNEFMNRLDVILHLLQKNNFEEAIKYIQEIDFD